MFLRYGIPPNEGCAAYLQSVTTFFSFFFFYNVSSLGNAQGWGLHTSHTLFSKKQCTLDNLCLHWNLGLVFKHGKQDLWCIWKWWPGQFEGNLYKVDLIPRMDVHYVIGSTCHVIKCSLTKAFQVAHCLLIYSMHLILSYRTFQYVQVANNVTSHLSSETILSWSWSFRSLSLKHWAQGRNTPWTRQTYT